MLSTLSAAPKFKIGKRAVVALLSAPTFLLGCGGITTGGSLFGPIPPTTPTAPTTNSAVTARNLYNTDLAAQAVDVYAANLNGSVAPSSSYAGGALSVTGDSSGNIYTATYSATQAGVNVYSSGSTTVSRAITVATAASNAPQINTLAVDSTGDLYVAISGTIVVFGPTATGAATPLRTIAGADTLLSQTAALAATQMAFDSSNNLYVAVGGGYKGSQVLEFPAGSNGDAAPTIITSADYFPSGVTLDAAGNIYIVQGSSPSPYNGTYTPAINVFPKGSVAGATPSRTIAGSNIGILIYTSQIYVDSGGNIFVGAVLNGYTDFLVYSATANGNVAPASVIASTKNSTVDSQFYVR